MNTDTNSMQEAQNSSSYQVKDQDVSVSGSDSVQSHSLLSQQEQQGEPHVAAPLILEKRMEVDECPTDDRYSSDSSENEQSRISREQVALLQLAQQLEQHDRLQKQQQAPLASSSTSPSSDRRFQQQLEPPRHRQQFENEVDAEEVDVDELDVSAGLQLHPQQRILNAENNVLNEHSPPVSPIQSPSVSMSPEELARLISQEQAVLLQLARQLEQQDQFDKARPRTPARQRQCPKPRSNPPGTPSPTTRPAAADTFSTRDDSNHSDSRHQQYRSDWETKRAAISPMAVSGLSPLSSSLSPRSSHSNDESRRFPPVSVLQRQYQLQQSTLDSTEEQKEEERGADLSMLSSSSIESFEVYDEGLPLSPRTAARKGLRKGLDSSSSSTSVVPVGAFNFTEGGTLDTNHPSTHQFLSREGSNSFSSCCLSNANGGLTSSSHHNIDEFDQSRQEQAIAGANYGRGDDILVHATVVDDDHHDNSEHDRIHTSLLSTRQQREEVVEATPVVKKPYSHRCIVASGIFGVVILVLALVFYFVVLKRNAALLVGSDDRPEYGYHPDDSGVFQPPPGPILQRVARRGVLLCGVHGLIRELVDWFGPDAGITDFFDLSICRAVAAAVFGDGSQFKAVSVGFDDPYQRLATGEIDMVVSFTTLNMMDDIREESTGLGFTFSTPYIYLEEVFGGHQKYIDCAERFDTTGPCSDMKVCFVEGTEKFSLYPRFPEKNIYKVEDVVDLVASYTNGMCQVASVLKGDFQRVLLGMLGHEGNFELGNITTNQGAEGLAVLTVDGDPEWSSFINSVILSILAADKANISLDTAELFGTTDLFGDDFKRMFINVIAAIGSYSEMYAREVEPFFPRTSINQLNDGSTGLILAYKMMPYAQGPAPGPNSTLARILDQGELRCAIRPNRPGFASWDGASKEWSGFDVDYCRGLGAVLFGGDLDAVTFVTVQDQSEGYAFLASRKVDIMAGGTWNVCNSVKEPTTGVGYSFSQPYFYAPTGTLPSNKTNATIIFDTVTFDENLCLTTRQDDAQWSSFVFWTVSFTFDAEHHETEDVNSAIPEVNLFGDDFKRMFRDILLSVGDYGKIYSRNLPFLPRSGRNLAIPPNESPPRHYVPPGFFD